MNLLDLFEEQRHPAYANLDALQQAVKTSRDAVLNFGGEPTTVEYPLARYILSRYQAQQTGADRGKFLAALTDARRFDAIAGEYRQLADKARLEGVEKDTGWQPAQKVHKDQYGNVIKHVAKHLAKQGLKQAQSDQEPKKKSDLEEKKKPKPTNPELWSRAKSAARSKFDVYPSAYANAWAAKWYKQHGGGWRMGKK